MKKGNYLKLGLIILCSFVLMYAAMFLNVDQFDHIMLSPTRTYMSVLMVAPMAISMLLFMWSMYKNKALNYGIIVFAIVAFASCYYSLRNQVLIEDVAYMKAMIPHHSSAIMVSQKANLKDPETKKLAQQIIESQKREIEQMKKIIQRLEEK